MGLSPSQYLPLRFRSKGRERKSKEKEGKEKRIEDRRGWRVKKKRSSILLVLTSFALRSLLSLCLCMTPTLLRLSLDICFAPSDQRPRVYQPYPFQFQFQISIQTPDATQKKAPPVRNAKPTENDRPAALLVPRYQCF